MINANNSGITTYHMAANPAFYEPSRNNTFLFVIPEAVTNELLAAGVTRDDSTIDDPNYLFDNVQEVVKLSVSEASVPHFELSPVEIRRGNSVMKFAGTPTFGDERIRCDDFVGARTKDILLAWQALSYNVADDVVELASRYKYDCTLLEYNPDMSKVIRAWTLKGCWIKTLNEQPFAHESHDKRNIEVTIIYDRAIPEMRNRELDPNVNQ